MYRIAILFLLCVPTLVGAQVLHQDLQETVSAEVLEIIGTEERNIIGTDTTAVVQEVRVLVREGLREGEEAVFLNDLVELEAGDRVYVNRLISIDGVEFFEFKDVDRRGGLLLLFTIFAALLIFIMGKKGYRALVSLGGSIAAILFVLVPLLLKGYEPVMTSVLVAGLILAFVLFTTHGLKPRTTIAFLGTFGAIIVTGIIAHIFVHMTSLTGLSSDVAVYLNLGTSGSLDFAGLLLGSILIGVLGVLDDVSITQASVVRELKATDPGLHARMLYLRAMRVGRDHVGSLVNTLAFAYVGVALPLVLLMAQAGSDFTLSINQEIVAVELVRILVGSIGLILAVPLTTMIAAWWFSRPGARLGSDDGHTHAH